MEDQRRLFVGNLPSDIREDEIHMVFNTYGRVSEVNILHGKNCCFVSYETVEAAKAAIQVLNEVYKFRLDAPSPIRVSVATRPRGGGKKGDSKGCGAVNPKGGGGYGPPPQKGQTAKGGDFRDHRDAMGSHRSGEEMNIVGAMEDQKRLFVGNLPNDIREDELLMVFNTYGRVSEVKILQGKNSCFVSYETVESAKAAIQVLHEVYKFRMDAPSAIRVSVAKPRGSGKNGDYNGCGGANSKGGGCYGPPLQQGCFDGKGGYGKGPYGGCLGHPANWHDPRAMQKHW